MKLFKNILKTLIVFTIIIPIGNLTAQNVRSYNITDGLSGNSVKSMIQDKNGYIWLATQDGLDVFNGECFKSFGCSYMPAADHDISALNILNIIQHCDGEQIWVATQSAKIQLFNPEDETFKALDIKTDGESDLQPNLCYSIVYDEKQNLWIGTDTGIFVYNEKLDTFRHYTTKNSSLPSDLVQCIICDSNNVIWIGSEEGVSKYNLALDDFMNVEITSPSGKIVPKCHIATLSEGDPETLWVGTWNDGLAKVDKNTNMMTFVRPSNKMAFSDNMRIRNILMESPGKLWLCTNVGLFGYNQLNNTMNQVILSALQPNDSVYSVLKDKEGGIWIGTYFKGVYYICPKARQIKSYTLDNVTENLYGSAISSFYEDSNGNIWITSENGGLSRFIPSENRFEESVWKNGTQNMHAVTIEGNELFIGTFTKGLYKIDLKTKKTIQLTRETYDGLTCNNIFSLYNDHNGNIYVGTSNGCSIYRHKEGKFIPIKDLNETFIYDITEDNHDRIWFACYYTGLYCYEKTSRTWTHYEHDDMDGSLPNDKLVKLYIDDEEQLWICSEGGGICRYDYESDNFIKMELRDEGGPINLSIVYGILNDESGNYWLSSNNGIWCCDSKGRILEHFTHEDGLQSNQYNFGASFRSSKGHLYFGGINGFNIINPETIQTNKVNPLVTVSINYKDDDGKVYPVIKVTDKRKIKIPRNISSFTLNFECLSYIAPKKNRFEYHIDNDKSSNLTKESSVTFIDFPHGKHTISVRAQNGDGLWSENEAILEIDNLPPLSQSTGAKLLYALTAIAIIIIFIRTQNRRREEKTLAALEQQRVEKEKQDNADKIQFFTNVAHEIKTPVTLIKGPLEVVLRNMDDDENKKNLDIVYKNTNRLLNLVNQLLDFKKMSSIDTQLNMVMTDVTQLVDNVVSRFKGTELEGLHVSAECEKNIHTCKLDTEAYTKILSNLMTNAMKHATSTIAVTLALVKGNENEVLHLSVTDDGKGIPEDEIPNIFNSFYQVGKARTARMAGVGLGLSLVKLLTEKHGGKVYVDESYHEGCRMCVDIPYVSSCKDASRLEDESLFEESDKNLDSQHKSSSKVLVVEDNDDMRNFICDVLSSHYKVSKAGDGRSALNKLQQEDFDIVISDISMPVMDGFELLNEIRSQDILCHIPVILLTVENSTETKIKGLEYGADAYIEKPFSTEHLIATVENILKRKESLQTSYLKGTSKQEKEDIFSTRDNEWLSKLDEYIQANIQETDISVESLASHMNLSQSSFQRKIKGLTGLSPVEFVRIIRLNKAAELLASGNYRVNEVSFLVGFNKPSYFSSLFKKQFGVQPKEYGKNNT